MSDDINIPGDEAYLSFGGWAQKVQNPPALHERRRYTVDVECSEAAVKTSEKGDRFTRKLSIIRVEQVIGAIVPPRDEDTNQQALFSDDGLEPIGAVIAGLELEASADEGDEIMAERAEKNVDTLVDFPEQDDDENVLEFRGPAVK